MRNIETFPSKQMYPYLSLVERKVAEFYHNIDRRRWLVWLKWLIFINFSGQLMVSLSGNSDENKSFNPNQSAPSIYIMIELCYFSLDQWEIRLHLLWGKSFNIPHRCDPRLNQTKFNDLLALTIHGVLTRVCQEFAIRSVNNAWE